MTPSVCIAGGGPAGMMTGLLLARAGVETLVLEKHGDFLRDFRGDTVHPSTLEIFHELGLLERFLARPHQEASQVSVVIGGREVQAADFSRLPTRCKFLAFMPQWEFLDFVREEASRYPTFHLRMESEVQGLIEERGQVVGLRAKAKDGTSTIRCELVIGADGRHSRVRQEAGLKVIDLGAPIDVLWLRITRHADDPEQLFGRIDSGRIFIMLNRGDYWQCAFVIPKGGEDAVRGKGIAAFRAAIANLAPFLAGRLDELQSFEQVKLLTVTVDRLATWTRPGLLCIGDAAHAMSPVGGVGINLAIQDAVATANLLADPLRRGSVTLAELARVQARRELPTKVTQRAQLLIQNRVLSRVLASDKPLDVPFVGRLLARFPRLRGLPALAVGVGIRPEHVRA